MRTYSFTVAVAGVTYGERQKALTIANEQGLRTVELRREPTNPGDPNAIAVLIDAEIEDTETGGKKLVKVRVGYIPNRAKCLVCDPEQKKHGHPSYLLSPNYICPDCSTPGMDPGTADKLAPRMDAHCDVRGEIIRYTGGENGKPTKGLLLKVEVDVPEE